MAFANALSPTDLVQQFERLKAVYGHAGAMGYKDAPQIFTAEWYAVVKGFRRDEFADAITEYLAGDHKFWPKPGEIRGLIFELRGRKNIQTVQHQREWYHEPTDWFAFPVTEKDVDGPRYRLQLVSLAQAKGLALVSQVECPIEGCHCWAKEVPLTPVDHGLSSHFASDRALGTLANVRPTGWKWAHSLTERV